MPPAGLQPIHWPTRRALTSIQESPPGIGLLIHALLPAARMHASGTEYVGCIGSTSHMPLIQHALLRPDAGVVPAGHVVVPASGTPPPAPEAPLAPAVPPRPPEAPPEPPLPLTPPEPLELPPAPVPVDAPPKPPTP